MQNELN